MKRLYTAISVIVLILLMCSCSASAPVPTPIGNNSNSELASASISDFFPIHENTQLIYQGEGNEYASYTVYPDYAGNDRLQQRIDTGGTTVVRVIEITRDRAVIVFSKGDVTYRQNMLDEGANPPEVLLKAPIQTGTAWLLSDGRIRTITGVGVQLDTPSGVYESIEVTTEGPYGRTTDYYTKDVGLVKTAYATENGSVTSVLARVEKDVPMVQTIRFYYPNAETDQLSYVDKDIEFYTNDTTRKVLAGAYKEPPAVPLGQVFSSGTKINSLYLNRDGMVYIDLNKAFQKEMNAGASYEQQILQSIANTFGHYFDATRVVLTVEGQPYESGHIAMRRGEYLTVDDGDTKSPAMWQMEE